MPPKPSAKVAAAKAREQEQELRKKNALIRRLEKEVRETRTSMTSFALDSEELEKLEAIGIIEKCARPKISLGVFKIPKKNGKARLLVDVRKFDEASASPLPPITPTLEDIDAFVMSWRFFCTLNFLGFFSQLPVAEGVAAFLGFRTPHGYYRFKVAVPGIARAPSMAQLTTCGLLRAADLLKQALAVYDDVALGSLDATQLAADRKKFLLMLDEAGVTVRDDKCLPISSEGVFDGVLLNLERKTVCVDPEWNIWFSRSRSLRL
ncbi:hypothetical protein DIPPA_06290 [Diplonema papillatum]|nr:hypothetical protein DIPPA_06290 [Diplonema papillatum]